MAHESNAYTSKPGGDRFHPIGEEFTAAAGRWVGAKVGLVALASRTVPRPGHADVDWFRIEPLAAPPR